ncbi:hypothetical protein BJY00DRAFT_318771 [Aspergillus carlsbadensis]|nr:hypothetical protein BJY00DRAFT_318771 [Aspergillus carlsbadensis]
MSISHIVLFQFKPDATPDSIRAACERMLSLKDKCLHPSTRKPYIVTSIGGRDNSIEGAQNGISHAFVVKFQDAADRDHYVREDPVHREFARSLDGLVERAQVIDFTNRVL